MACRVATRAAGLSKWHWRLCWWKALLPRLAIDALTGGRTCSHGRPSLLPRAEASLLQLVALLQRPGTRAACPCPHSCKGRPAVLPMPAACATNIDWRSSKGRPAVLPTSTACATNIDRWCSQCWLYVLPTPAASATNSESATGGASNGRRRSCKRFRWCCKWQSPELQAIPVVLQMKGGGATKEVWWSCNHPPQLLQGSNSDVMGGFSDEGAVGGGALRR